LTLVATEDAPALGVQRSLLDEPVDGPPGLERRVQLDERVGPEEAVGQVLVHEAADTRIGDVEKAARVLGVVLDQPLAKVEDVHWLVLASDRPISASTESQGFRSTRSRHPTKERNPLMTHPSPVSDHFRRLCWQGGAALFRADTL